MRNIVIGIILVGAVIGGGIWWQQSQNHVPGTPYPELVTWVDRGIDAANRARLEARVELLIEKIGGDRDIADLDNWIELGNTKNILGDLAGARAAYETALELNALNYVSWGNLGDTLSEMGDLAGAEAAYRKALDLVGLALYYEKYANFLHRFPDRKDDYENLLKLAVERLGQRPEFIGALAAFYETEGRLLEAQSHLEVLVRLVPDNEGARRDLERVNQKIAEQD